MFFVVKALFPSKSVKPRIPKKPVVQYIDANTLGKFDRKAKSNRVIAKIV